MAASGVRRGKAALFQWVQVRPDQGRRHIRSCHVDIDEFHSTLCLLYRRFGRAEAEVTLPAGAGA